MGVLGGALGVYLACSSLVDALGVYWVCIEGVLDVCGSPNDGYDVLVCW